MANSTNYNVIQAVNTNLPPVEFIHGLKEAYGIEKQHIRLLGEMLRTATGEDIKALIEDHLDITEVQEKRIEEIFRIMNVNPSTVRQETMETLTQLAEGTLNSNSDSFAKDASILNICQKIEQFEIEFYKSLCTMSKVTGNEDIIDMLQATLEEEDYAKSEMIAIAKNNLVNA